ncbi:unnamed protein product [Rodentolepis nana]|uniref:PAP-associated domain-containing protein n=1 Tax=Rodentolepis nana TaxID=102285 RepID=A0A0R3T3B9_RODNA|nr:unnamed protein product [Rodentolepis nana]
MQPFLDAVESIAPISLLRANSGPNASNRDDQVSEDIRDLLHNDSTNLGFYMLPARSHQVALFFWQHLRLDGNERGVCAPTVAMCFLFLYVELAIRLRDPKTIPLSIDLCRPFAAHWYVSSSKSYVTQYALSS